MLAAEVIAQACSPYAFGKVGRAIAGVEDVAEDGFERAGAWGRPHDADLRARPVEHLRADRMTFGRVGVEQVGWRVAPDGRRELPREVHRVAQSQIQPLAAHGRMNVRCVACEQHASLAIGGGLMGAIGPGGRQREGVHGDVGVGDAA